MEVGTQRKKDWRKDKWYSFSKLFGDEAYSLSLEIVKCSPVFSRKGKVYISLPIKEIFELPSLQPT